MTRAINNHRAAGIQRPSHRRSNALAILIAFSAVGVMYLNFDSSLAGTDATAADVSRVAAAIAEPVIAMRPGAESSRPTNGAATSSGSEQVSGRIALLLNLLLLEKGRDRFAKVPGYTATFYKKERVGGSDLESQVVRLKMRHQPFSVYMKWLVGDKGRELLYVAGQNSGKIIVKVGGVKGRLLPALKLDPTGSLAMRESRYPVTMAGLLRLSETLIGYRRRELQQKSGTHCRMIDNQRFDGRPCYCFIVTYDSPAASKEYRKSITFLDKKRMLPVCVKNYGWPEGDATGDLDKTTLIEHYAYTDIRVTQQLADSDFASSNRNYHFRR